MKQYTEEQIKKAFSIFNSGSGLDHWSYSSTSTPFAKNLINYTFSQDFRRSLNYSYKADFGNLVNNTNQYLVCYEKYLKENEKIIIEDRDYDSRFNYELKIINEKDPIDKEDAFAREAMLDYAHACIDVTKKIVLEIMGKEKITCERFIRTKQKGMIKEIVGRIDYETGEVGKAEAGKAKNNNDDSKNIFIELKTKPPRTRKKRNEEEWTMYSQALPTEPMLDHLTQTAYYYMATKKKPFLVYVNDKEYVVFDDTHELLKPDHLEQLYYRMINKIITWESMIMFAEGNIYKLANMCEQPDLNHYFYYKNLAPEQTKLIKELWGV
jgi:hypothetical protein